MAPHSLANLLCGNHRTWRPKVLVNRALGLQIFEIDPRFARRYARLTCPIPQQNQTV
jgi:hypothetical protein